MRYRMDNNGCTVALIDTYREDKGEIFQSEDDALRRLSDNLQEIENLKEQNAAIQSYRHHEGNVWP